MATKGTKKKPTKQVETTVEIKGNASLIDENIKSEIETIDQGMNNNETNVQKKEINEHLFTIDVSNYGIKKDEAEKLVNIALKFYFENKDKTFIISESEEIKEEDDKSDKINTLISDYEKSLKLFNYVPKNKILSFLKLIKENL